ncbi:MAG: M1 family metallopeptidase [Cyclobacteriaceae bacterium]
MKRTRCLCLFFLISTVSAQQSDWKAKFEPLDDVLPTPNNYRLGSGAPGPDYWQQRADYNIKVSLDETNQVIAGEEVITYFNNSPNDLSYLWIQLDQNVRKNENFDDQSRSTSVIDSTFAKFGLVSIQGLNYDFGYKIEYVRDGNNKNLTHRINNTMMRVDLPEPLRAGTSTKLSLKWSYKLNDRMIDYGRSGYEYFPEDDNYVYTIAQFYPRMAVYDDFNGWQNRQFVGSGEFALTFGNYDVEITVPFDHIVAATGTLSNPAATLSEKQEARLNQARKSFDKPIIIVTENEAKKNEAKRSAAKKTWKFKAENVRDFAFASSRKFIWDAQAVRVGENTPLAMSFYPKEGNPLWEKESTLAVKNTLEFYSSRTIDYPYPVAISVHAANIGMEYPMICFNFGRPNPDGTYSTQKRSGMIGVIIHEVGHNFFPMIVNSDERQWAWMDEGLNTFLEKETKRVLYPDVLSSWGTPKGMVPYMSGDKNFIRPIMTTPDQVTQLGPNAYGKPSAALTLLREVIMGPELFDDAFKKYSETWAFKHPKPADFFRAMEDASSVDLDWFWRGWFYTTDYVDVSLSNVRWFKIRKDETKLEDRLNVDNTPNLSEGNDQQKDFSNGPERFSFANTPEQYYGEFRGRADEGKMITDVENKNFYELSFENKGGLVSPLIVNFQFTDGTNITKKIPAEIWRYNETKVSKVFIFEKEVARIDLDPEELTGDAMSENNSFPRVEEESKFEELKNGN